MKDLSSLCASAWRGAIYAAGGSLLISDIATTPGASNTLLDATIPYSNHAMTHLLGYEPDSHCSSLVSRQLAMKAFLRARHFASALPDDHSIFGFGITAALRSTNPKRGAHRAYLALQTSTKTLVWYQEFEKDALSRLDEERRLANASIEFLFDGLELHDSNPTPAPTMRGSCNASIATLFSDTPARYGDFDTVVLPGAFNPLHAGHQRMRAVAEDLLGKSVAYELCVRNVDKPPLDCIDIEERVRQFDSSQYVLTNQPTFLEKAKLLFRSTGGVFVVGTDTMTRIAQTRYYGSEEERDDAIDQLRNLEVRFLVFGRYDGRRFISVDDLKLDPCLREICEGVAEAEFRVDVSSTELRLAPDHCP